jgi:c-di-GMP-binding flagellar brake protein YcgR
MANLDIPDPAPPPQQEIPSPEPKAAHRVERLPGVNMRLHLGSTLTMRLACVDQKYEGKVVGLEDYGYIIVQARLPQDTLTRLGQNNQLVGQAIVDGAAYGFRSQVINRVSKPAPLLFLSYPDSVERLVLRSDQRIRVSLPGNIHGKYGDQSVMIVDMTNSGCRISAKTDLKNPLREIQPGDEFLLSTVLGQSQKFMSPVIARRVEAKMGLLFLGCQFKELNEEATSMVGDYVKSIASYMREAF